MNDLLVRFTIFVIVMVFAIPLHELGHAVAANYCGDDIPGLQGRITAEPWVHWDLVGSILIGIGIFASSPIPILGWGKPVQTDPAHYRNGRRGRLLVASAGILVNLLLVAVGVLLYRGLQLASITDAVFNEVCRSFVFVNLSLAAFNLLPIPPLDGSKIVIWLLPVKLAIKLERHLQAFGIIILLFVVWQGGGLIKGALFAAANFLLGR